MHNFVSKETNETRFSLTRTLPRQNSTISRKTAKCDLPLCFNLAIDYESKIELNSAAFGFNHLIIVSFAVLAVARVIIYHNQHAPDAQHFRACLRQNHHVIVTREPIFPYENSYFRLCAEGYIMPG